MQQQEQTRIYFESNAKQWHSKATQQEYSVIENRHQAVMSVLNELSNANTFLDVGCGTGQLVIQVAKHGLLCDGIDFAQEMINLCEDNKKRANVEANFEWISFSDFELKENYYDVISAQGFIEYITLDQLPVFLSRCYKALKTDGSLVLGSRNRLFNLHSLNEFTKLEIEMGTVHNLLLEATVLHSSESQSEALFNLRKLERIDPQPYCHPITGIKIETRFQFSPADLIFRLRYYGYEPKTLFPIHYHGLPVNTKKNIQMSEIHNQLAQLVSEKNIRDHQLIPFSSSFVIEAKKPIK